MILEIKDLHVSLEDKEIIKGLNLKIGEGEVHVIMGPNGSGKSTLAKSIMGHPHVRIMSGDILVDGKSIKELKTDERAKLGLFLQFQNPVEVEGVGFINFLHAAKQSMGDESSTKDFMKGIKDNISNLKMGENFIGRSLNQGFSGGEKKKAEILQMAVLKPKMSILDEPDSGLDIDAIKVVSENVNKFMEGDKGRSLLIITHYSRILSFIKPDFVHVMVNGKVVAEGKGELIEKLEKEGYDSYVKE
ncbi:MAG: Fe-S cluster assembly ATPase SufC [Candidatus Micrarchaeota archaeon]|nr:Fe-S cluster assembly ATPase SufC [Candidatus Micrarchaeota archaeon]